MSRATGRAGPKPRLDGLDGLRGIAALAVFAHHALRWPGSNAFLAVDFFFMLSGYVMARTYEDALGAEGAGGAFVLARVRRLWPTVALASLVGMPVLIYNAGPAPAALIGIANLLLVPTFAIGQTYVLNPPVWSVAFELLANGLHAGLIHRLRGRVGILALALVVAGFVGAAAWRGDVNFGVAPETFWLGPLRVMAGYGIGVALWRCWRDTPPIAVPAWLTWSAMPAWFVIGTLTIGTRWWADLAFILLLCPLLIAGGLRHGRGSRLAARAGALSFPLYAIHGPVLLTTRALGLSVPAQIAAALVAALALEAGLARLTVTRKPRPALA